MTPSGPVVAIRIPARSKVRPYAAPSGPWMWCSKELARVFQSGAISTPSLHAAWAVEPGAKSVAQSNAEWP